MVRAPTDRWQLLGELLQLRRSELGYRRRPAFVADRDINIRLVTDIENAYRPNTFLTPTLREIAQAYAVTYASMIAVLSGERDALAPAVPDEEPLPRAPMEDPAREAAVHPYATVIWERLLDLAGRGVRDPSGAQLGLDAADAKVWDGSAGAMSRADRAWLVADLQRRRAARHAAGNSGATSA